MKKMKKIILALAAVMIATLGMSIMAYADDYSAKYTEVQVNKVDDVTDTLNIPGYGINNGLTEVKEAGVYNYYYTFTLTKPSYVYIKSFARAVEYNFQSDMYVFLSNSKSFVESPIIECWMIGKSGEYKTALEPGRYYIKVNCDIRKGLLDNKELNLGIYTEEVVRTGSNLGTTIKKPIPTSNKQATGYITKTSKNQWFKFTVDSKSDVTLKTILTSPLQWKDGTAKVQVYNADGSTYGSYQEISGGTNGNSTTFNLKGMPKGTYYVCVSNAKTDQFFSIKQTVSVKDTYKPNKPKVTAYKKNSKYVSGTGEAGTTVIIRYNNKTYKGKVGSNGKFKVKVAKLKSKKTITVKLQDKAGNTSATASVKVK